jgi:hypothetical protein
MDLNVAIGRRRRGWLQVGHGNSSVVGGGIVEGERTGWSAHRQRSSVGAVFTSGVQLLLVLVGRHLRLRRMASPISGQHRRSRGPGPAARPLTRRNEPKDTDTG